MDWTDENDMKDDGSHWSFGDKTTIDCDEHLCRNLWSCGDGQCTHWYERFVFQNILFDVPCPMVWNLIVHAIISIVHT